MPRRRSSGFAGVSLARARGGGGGKGKVGGKKKRDGLAADMAIWRGGDAWTGRQGKRGRPGYIKRERGRGVTRKGWREGPMGTRSVAPWDPVVWWVPHCSDAVRHVSEVSRSEPPGRASDASGQAPHGVAPDGWWSVRCRRAHSLLPPPPLPGRCSARLATDTGARLVAFRVRVRAPSPPHTYYPLAVPFT